MKKLYWVLCLAFLSLSLSVNAQSSAEFCKKYATDIVSKIKVKPDMRAKTDDVQCKIWPTNPKFALLTWEVEAFSRDGYSDVRDGDIEIAIVSSTTGDMISHFTDQGVMFNDAAETYGVKLDTARYELDESTMAFAVRFSRGNRHGNNQHLNLYILKNKKINKVLTSLRMEMNIYESYGGGCKSDTRKSKSFIIIQDRKMKNGFSSLLIKRTFEKGENRLVGETDICKERLLKTTKSSTSLIFDGTQYNIPEDYRAF